MTNENDLKQPYLLEIKDESGKITSIKIIDDHYLNKLNQQLNKTHETLSGTIMVNFLICFFDPLTSWGLDSQ
jgi:hypothetical protein